MDLRKRLGAVASMPFRAIKSRFETVNQIRIAKLDEVLFEPTVGSVDILYAFPTFSNTTLQGWQFLNT